MVVSSGPNRRLKAICRSSSSVCPRKSSTECSSKAPTIRAKTSSSRWLTSTPTISTPSSGCSGLVTSGAAIMPPEPRSLLELEILVRRRVRMERDEPEAGLLDAGPDAVQEAKLPERCRHDTFVGELLDLVQ